MEPKSRQVFASLPLVLSELIDRWPFYTLVLITTHCQEVDLEPKVTPWSFHVAASTL